MPKELIYAIEDEENIRELIKCTLSLNRYDVVTFVDAETALKSIEVEIPNLILLDIMLPGIDGFEFCRRIRENASTKKIPIIMLTAKSEEFDKVLGLELGSDDYITKPFSVRELSARIKAVLRRAIDNSIAVEDQAVRFGHLFIDFTKREVKIHNTIVELAFKEFELLKIFVKNKGRILTRELLLEKIWGYDYIGETRTIDVHIRHLRQKIKEDNNNPVFIETIRSVGYRFNYNELN